MESPEYLFIDKGLIPMETYNLNTSQNVSLEFRIASVADRMLAYALDILIIGITALIISLIISQTGFGFSPWMLIMLLPVLFYHFLFEMFFNGQSLGKMIMGIRVVKVDGSQLTIGSCFIRWIFRLIDITLMGGAVAVLVIIINGKGQRLGDLAASTTVLKTNRQGELERTIWTEIEENYQIRFPQVEFLSEKDIQVVKDVLLAAYKNGYSSTSSDLVKKTRAAINDKTGISSELNDRSFLVTILKDFNAYHQLQ